jgi:carbon starvation protein CstA
MFCTKCGNKLTDGAKFCIKCGKPLSQTFISNTQSDRKETSNNRNTFFKKHNSTILVVISAGVLATLQILSEIKYSNSLFDKLYNLFGIQNQNLRNVLDSAVIGGYCGISVAISENNKKKFQLIWLIGVPFIFFIQYCLQ